MPAIAEDVPAWLKDAKASLKGLGTPNPRIYWADFLLTLLTGYGFAWLYFDLPGLSVLRVASFVLAALLIFRASSFVHEIVHLRDSELKRFRICWDLLCGIPTLFPSFAYMHHLDHHRCDSYGTEHDGEYLPFGNAPPTTILLFFLLTLVWPLLVAFRFLIVTPVSFLHPGLRRWVLEHFSSFGIAHFQYKRVVSASSPLRYWAFLDLACFLRTLIPVVLVSTGVHHWTRVPMLYLLAIAILTLNFVRALCLHSYRNRTGAMTFMGQLQESITLPHNALIAELFIPLGLRYHALHHLFPNLPYHCLGEAHRRLMQTLPAGSAYHETVHAGIGPVLRQLWKNSCAAWLEESKQV